VLVRYAATVSDFSYDFPDKTKYLTWLRVKLKSQDGPRARAALLLEGAKVSFASDGSYSGNRWNAHDARVRIAVDVARMADLEKLKPLIRQAAQQVMPDGAGYDISELVFVPIDADQEDDGLPDVAAFLHTLGEHLQQLGERDAFGCLLKLHPSSASFSARGGNAQLRLKVPVGQLAVFEEHKHTLHQHAQRVLSGTRYYLTEVELVPLIQAPPDELAPKPPPTWKPEHTTEFEGIHFRSKTEIRIYEALKKRPVLFFVNATAVLGGRPLRSQAHQEQPP